MAKKKKRMEYRYYEIPADTYVLPLLGKGWEQEYGVGIVMNAFRICLVGAARGPHIWEITNVLGKEETIRRVKVALETIKP